MKCMRIIIFKNKRTRTFRALDAAHPYIVEAIADYYNRMTS